MAGAPLAGLPAPFAAEVRIWTEALHGRGPRAARSRHPRTIEAYLRILDTPLAAWAAQYGSLRQVTTDDLAAQLAPLTGATRRLAMAAMRSLFTTLKARRVLFTNPAAPLTGRALQPPPVLPLDDTQRARLLGALDEPAQRLIVLLAGVHALRPSQIRALTLDAVGPGAGTLLTGGRAQPLDQLTTQHLRAWLVTRRACWPATANPYLLINRSTAGGVKPVSRGYVQDTARRAASPPAACAPTGCWPKPTPPAATRWPSPTCSGSVTPPPSATAPRSAALMTAPGFRAPDRSSADRWTQNSPTAPASPANSPPSDAKPALKKC